MPSDRDEGAGEKSLQALQLEYEYLRDENLRLRDSRASLTRQLGPLPIGAAVVAGLVAGFTSRAPNNGWLWAALLLFVVLATASVLYSSMKPYRELRAEYEPSLPPRSEASPEAWYQAAIKLERKVYGEDWRKAKSDLGYYERHRPSRKISGLQEGYDRERSGLFIVQGLFAVVIVLLIVSRVV